MANIFISYRKKDREYCRALQRRLEDAGHSVWTDDKILPSDNFMTAIDGALCRADAVVVLWTRNAVRSKWVYFEAMMAAGMEKLVIFSVGNVPLPEGKLAGYTVYPYDPREAPDGPIWHDIVGKLDKAISSGRPATESLDDVAWSFVRQSHDVEDFRDYLEQYPDGRHRVAAEAKLGALARRDQRRSLLWWTLALLFYLCLAIPSLTLLVDYGGNRALRMGALYFPFFGFSLLFGSLIVPVYCFTQAKAVRYAMRGEGHLWQVALMVVAPIISCAVIAYVEVSDGYAPWQFNSSILATPLSRLALPVSDRIETITGERDIRTDDRTLLDIFDSASEKDLRSLWDSRNQEPGEEYCLAAPDGVVLKGEGSAAARRACTIHMNNLQRVMEVQRTNHANWSWTAAAYKWLFFFQALALIGTYFSIFFLCWRSEEVRMWMSRLSPWSGHRFGQLLNLFAAQLLFISVWFVARMIFQLGTQTILPSSGGEQFAQAIRNFYFFFLAVYGIAVGFVLAAALRINGPAARAGIVIGAVVVPGFLALSFFTTSFVNSLQSVIGARANSASIIILAILMVFILLLPLILPNMLKLREEDLRPRIFPKEDVE